MKKMELFQETAKTVSFKKRRQNREKMELFRRCVYTGEPLPSRRIAMVRRIKGIRRPVKKTIHV